MAVQPGLPVSLNELTRPLIEALIRDAAKLRIAVSRAATGATIVDAGIVVPGSIEAGLRISEICLGGLGTVTLSPGSAELASPFMVTTMTSSPVLACLASQYAGWSLQDGDFFALGSGPGRALFAGENLYGELGYKDKATCAALVVETSTVPPDAVLRLIAKECGVDDERLVVVLTPTSSLAGSTQVVARSLEVALHKAHELHFPLERIVDGIGTAPLPPPIGDFIQAMGRTNDAILYGGTVHLFVTGPADDAADLAAKLPSSASKDYGRPFADIFKDYAYDFYKVDPHLFSPGLIQVTAVESGRSIQRGRLAPDILAQSFVLDR